MSIESYDNRMLTAPRFVREGNRLIPAEALVRIRTGEDHFSDAGKKVEDPR